jgi:uncharacterized protein YkwD
MACISSACVFVFLLTQNSHNYAQAASLEYNADQVILLVNRQRETYNLAPLQREELLTKAASNKTKHMMQNNYFSHVSPVDGKKWSDFIQEANYEYVEAGENLANGYTNAEEMVKAWMDSPTHRANILADGYAETGVAIDRGSLNGHETIYVAQVFGRQ